MIDKESARQAVQRYFCDHFDVRGEDFVLIDHATIEKEYGWIFFYNSKRYLESGDYRFALAGNGPLLVEKDSGVIFDLGSALSLEQSLREYEAVKACTVSQHA